MPLNRLIKKQQALALLAKIKKCEYEQSIQLYNQAVFDHTDSHNELNAINQEIDEADHYASLNFLDRYSSSLEKYADYLVTKKHQALAAESQLRQNVASLLNEGKSKNKIHKAIKDKTAEVNKKINNFLDFHCLD